ncbi:MAG: RDD family protein [Microbacterium sp.]
MIWEIDETPRSVEGLDDNGRPRPEYAASLGLVPAPFGRRALATTIEVFLYLLLLLPLLIGALPGLLALAADPAAAGESGTPLVLIIVCVAVSYALTTVFVIVQLVLHGRRGVTLGKAVTGLRSVNVRTLERPGFWRGAVVRALVLWGSFIVPLIGPLLVIAISPFFDVERRGRGWVDLAGATWLVDVRGGLNPYDAKRMRIARKTVATDLDDVRSELPSLATPVGEPAEAYIRVSRNSGGVLGAHRADDQVAGGQPPAPSAAPVAPAPLVAPVAGPAATPASSIANGAGWVPPKLLPDGPSESAAPVPVPAPAPVAQAAPTAPPAAARVTAAPSVELVLDDGRTLDVRGGGILIGRDPVIGADDVDLTPVAITDSSRSVSKTHAAILRTGGDVLLVDRGSTNGCGVVRDGVEREATPFERVPLRTGDTIRLGDRHGRIRIG